MPTDGCAHGEPKGWKRIPTIGAGSEEKYDRHLAATHQDWNFKMIGSKIYQSTVMILNDIGNWPMWRKINSRWAMGEECGSMTGRDEEGWKSTHVLDWFRALKGGIMSHVQASPFEIIEILIGINREQDPRAGLRIGTSWKKEQYSARNIARKTADRITGRMDTE